MSKSEKFWDRMAKNYDREEENDKPVRTKVIERSRKYLKTEDSVLDFGCGTGLFCHEIAENVKLIHAIDISSNMIEIAKRKGEERKIKNIEYFHTTIFNEKYEKDSYDVILTFYILHLLEDSTKVMNKINELLKPGGLLISLTPCIGERNRLISILFSFLSKIRLVPKIRSFKFLELEELIIKGNFEITETEQVHSPEYFIVAKKVKEIQT
ncbi:MAG: class I SAM-dependent methyltransferase [Candidatus Hodarchaeales archaeon]|jgi:2-polyprenyl-3-methyl-5-hydroxy-6-metoxy-1,4-benzoquinol methylase